MKRYIYLLYKHQWNSKWAFAQKLHIFTHENTMLPSHVKRSPSLWLHNKSHLFHWCLYSKQNITCPLVVWILSSCSTRYLTNELCSLVRYRVEHLKITFISTHGHVISMPTLGAGELLPYPAVAALFPGSLFFLRDLGNEAAAVRLSILLSPASWSFLSHSH